MLAPHRFVCSFWQFPTQHANWPCLSLTNSHQSVKALKLATWSELNKILVLRLNKLMELRRKHMHLQEESCHASEELLHLYLSMPKELRDKRFADTAHTAEFIGMSQRTVLFWIETGAIRAILIGGKFKVDLDSVATYLKKNALNKNAIE